MDSDYYSSDEEIENIVIDDIPNEVINMYEEGIEKECLELYAKRIVYLLEMYDIDMQMLKFEEHIDYMYEDTINEYLYRECPEKIFDKNRYGLKHKFIQWSYKNTERGNELDYLYKIYNSLIN